VSKHILERFHIEKKAFYSSLGHSSISVQFCETSLNCTNQSIRGRHVWILWWRKVFAGERYYLE